MSQFQTFSLIEENDKTSRMKHKKIVAFGSAGFAIIILVGGIILCTYFNVKLWRLQQATIEKTTILNQTMEQKISDLNMLIDKLTVTQERELKIQNQKHTQHYHNFTLDFLNYDSKREELDLRIDLLAKNFTKELLRQEEKNRHIFEEQEEQLNNTQRIEKQITDKLVQQDMKFRQLMHMQWYAQQFNITQLEENLYELQYENEEMKKNLQIQNETIEEISMLKNRIEVYENKTAQQEKGYIELDDGWISPLNGFEYKFFATFVAWSTARQHCRNDGGDLAVYGMQNMRTRRILVDALKIQSHFWIGLNDQNSESTWYWIDTSSGGNSGDRAIDGTAFWITGRSSSSYSSSRDCAYVYYTDLLTRDYYCSYSRSFLCEKSL